MFCSKCGIENQEGAQVCRNCNFSLLMTPQASKTSKLAIASFWLGILSPFTCLLTAPFSIIFGIISLTNISNGKGLLKGKTIAYIGIIFPIITFPFLMGILMPALARLQMITPRINCGKNMATLGKAINLYVEHNHKYPTTSQWCDLLIEIDPNLSTKKSRSYEKNFKCPYDPIGPCSYSMNVNLENKRTTLKDVVLLFESKPGWNQAGGPELLNLNNHQEEGCNITFCDGHTKFIKPKDVNNLIWTTGP